MYEEITALKPKSKTLDAAFLTTKITDVLQGYLAPQVDITPHESLTLDLLVKISQVAGINRVRAVSVLKGAIPANLYALIFMPSGSGKDKPVKMLDRLLTNVQSDFTQRAQEWRDGEMQRIQKEADDRFGSAKGLVRNHVVQNEPRFLATEFGDGTLEGFLAMREAYAGASFGAPLVKISEFADYLTSETNSRGEFLSIITEVFDLGDSEAKVTKGNKHVKSVKGVPCTALFHTALYGVYKDKKTYSKLLNGLARGLARRAYCCYPDMTDGTGIQPDLDMEFKKALQQMGKINKELAQYMAYFDDMYKQTEVHPDFVYTDDAQRLYFIYSKYCQAESAKIKDPTMDVLRAEVSNRHWKTYKLAAVIAAFEHPNDPQVLDADVRCAIYLSELYGLHFEKFIKQRESSMADEVFAMLRQASNYLTKSDIREAGIINKNNFKQRWPGVLDDIQEIAYVAGFDLEIVKVGKTEKYKLVQKEYTDTRSIRLSYSNDITTNYCVTEVDFAKLHTLANSKYNYSASQFMDGYRDTLHFVDGNNCIILDIDDGWTIAQAKKFLRDRNLLAMISTTKSHQKDKNGTTCDRFRIFLPTKTTFKGTPQQFSYMMSEIFHYFVDKPDVAAKDCTRFYYGNPNGTYEYLDGELLFDIDMFDREPSRRPPANAVISSHSGNHDQIVSWFIDNAAPGSRNRILFRAYKFLVDDGKSDSEAYAVVTQINAKLVEPLTDKEVRTICRMKV